MPRHVAVQWVESRRGYDIKNPGSMDQDPIFSNFKLPAHEVRPPASRVHAHGRHLCSSEQQQITAER